MFHHAGLSKEDLSDQQLKKGFVRLVCQLWLETNDGGDKRQGAQHVLRFPLRRNVGLG